MTSLKLYTVLQGLATKANNLAGALRDEKIDKADAETQARQIIKNAQDEMGAT